jgi:WD40-like Beta Propeller Repeat
MLRGMKPPIFAALLALAACGPSSRGANGDGGQGGPDAAPQMVTGTRNEGSAPANSGQLFGSATETPSLAPSIVYPANGIVAPPNLGEFDVHWTQSTDNLFAVHFGNQYADYTVYTTGQPGGNWWTVLTPDEWARLATTLNPMQVTVAGMNTSTPTMKGTSTAITVSAATEPILGGVYYWSTSSSAGAEGDMFHYDTSQPSVPAAPYYTAQSVPGGCIGCHALSHDGTKLAFTTVTVPGPGEIVNTADQSALVAAGSTYWDFATFNADGSKLVTADDNGAAGQLTLRSASTGASLATIPASPGKFGDHPDLSPDGTLLANVETSNQDGLFPVIMPDTGAIVVRTFDDATNAFGAIKTVIADDASGASGLSSFYPSFSPDGQWLLVTRVNASQNSNTENGAVGVYANPASKTWVVKADGSQPPIELAQANSTGALGDSWARWAPFSETDTTGAQLYFITFTSVRQFGVRIPQVGSPQIWMSPFYPAKATAGTDPSGPAFRVPFQDVTNHNHIAQWSQEVVVID